MTDKDRIADIQRRYENSQTITREEWEYVIDPIERAHVLRRVQREAFWQFLFDVFTLRVLWKSRDYGLEAINRAFDERRNFRPHKGKAE